ncbi:DUF4012 domain-containing protein, partial [Candidatus Parcubacteria bacterium]|nr:DUF4012 domain-containing protein [Candidatus Parcubacteria bacterium]
AELAQIGASLLQTREAAKPHYKPIPRSSLVRSLPNDSFSKLAREIERSARSTSQSVQAPKYEEEPAVEEPIVDVILASAPSKPLPANHPVEDWIQNRPILKKNKPKWPKFNFRFSLPSNKILIVGAVALVGLASFAKYGLRVKQEATNSGTVAVQNLQEASSNLKALDFAGASNNFIKAYESFAQAGEHLGLLGLVGDLPGGGSVKSAKNLIKVGQLLSDAGAAMTQALSAVQKTGSLANLDNANVPVGPIMDAMKKALIVSAKDINDAKGLLADIDDSIIPEDKRAVFDELKQQIPEFSKTINDGIEFAKFLQNLTDGSGTKRYLILLENPSELRPVGGFPGTYALLEFNDGKLQKLFVDDVYNADGQLKELIVPPLQLQHITPTWGMRDANWFIDFPTSARKVQEFYKKDTGQPVDGVFAVNPKIVADILKITGPIAMPEYKLTLTQENLLTTIQDQVEYGANRVQPKQVVKDFAAKLFNKIYDSPSAQWMAMFNVFIQAMNDKEVLMSFNNLSLETFAVDHGFSGKVSATKGDYVMPTITNVKGSKTDTVTDTSFILDTKFEAGSVVHTLTITRVHNGGKTKFGFYNKQNPAYIRVLVPDNAELIGVNGNDNPNFAPLVQYDSSIR